MLDLQKLIPQIVALAEATPEDQDVQTKILSLAQTSFEEAASNSQQLESVLKENASTTFWPVAIPLEPFGQQQVIEPLDDSHSVVACDGSQIMPTQHEVHSCYLLNIGAAVLHYSDNSRAMLASFPQLFHSTEDLYPLIGKRRIHIDESLVSFERGLREMQKAREFAEQEMEMGNRVLALIDGSLIPFNIDRNPDAFQKELLERFGVELDAFNAAQIPVLGYISHSRSSDIVNILRVWRCPYPESRCQLNCGSVNEEEFPCSEIWPLSDRQLLATKLDKNARSNVFLSGARWSTALAQRNQICFAYLHCGQEAARVELPYWLFEDKDLLNFAFSSLLVQVDKGQGYPISLSEAHNLAVIRQADRLQFFQLLTQQLVRGKQSRVGVSPKESKKRRGII